MCAWAVRLGCADRSSAWVLERTVNKERARSGESKTASRSSTHGNSASQRGGQKSGSGGGGSSERTKDELYQEARMRGIEGRSTMTKQQLKNCLDH
ncbi:plasmid stabilization protein [Streptomyces sp. NPDC002138]|uniref:plasmid stabilization protein n=1 Tax=Streptomyces sp. NPDC002138 TaxID=3154410 RepID=UPI0033340FE0